MERKRKKQQQTLCIQMGSDIRLLSLIETASAVVLKVIGVDEDEKFRISMAIREAVINAIHHGNKDDLSKKVSISYNYDDCSLEVKVRDEGNGFDYMSLPDPTKKENILKPFGRGIFFIRTFMDEVNFGYQKNRGLTIKMHKKFGKQLADK